MNKRSLLIRFYQYQKSRFPIFIIGLSLIPAILSSGTIVSVVISPFQVIFALVISIMYLLHIRILDDRRDFKHDSIHHKSRPVQKGVITNKELWKIDAIICPFLILATIPFGFLALTLMIVMLSYSFFAEKNFFLDKTLKKHFFVYNFANTFQTFFLQLFVYVIFAGTIPLTILLLTHYLFTCVGTIIFEFVRKVKLPEEDGSGRDTYTWHLGFRKALIIFGFLALINLVLFYKIMITISNLKHLWLLFSIVTFFVIALLSYMHLKKRNSITEVILQVSFMLIYALCNLLIFFFKI